MHKCHSQSASVDFLFDMTLKSCLNLKICVSQWWMKMKLKKEDQPPKVISLFKHYFRWFVVERSFPTKCYCWLKPSQIQQLTSGFLGQGSKHFCHLASRCKALMAPEINIGSLKHLGITGDCFPNTDIKHITIISLIFTYIIRNTFRKKCNKYESNNPVLFQCSNSVAISVRNSDGSWAVCLDWSVDEILRAGQWVKNNIYTHLINMYIMWWYIMTKTNQ